MTITKTATLVEIRITNASSDSPILLLTEDITIDDPNDDQLPITHKNRRAIPQHTENSDGEMVATNLDGESSLVQSICAVVWPTE